MHAIKCLRGSEHQGPDVAWLCPGLLLLGAGGCCGQVGAKEVGAASLGTFPLSLGDAFKLSPFLELWGAFAMCVTSSALWAWSPGLSFVLLRRCGLVIPGLWPVLSVGWLRSPPTGPPRGSAPCGGLCCCVGGPWGREMPASSACSVLCLCLNSTWLYIILILQ